MNSWWTRLTGGYSSLAPDFHWKSGSPITRRDSSTTATDLTISAVSDLVTAIELLRRLGIQCIVPEAANGTVWVIPQLYTPDEIRKMLAHLPCTFADQGFWNRVDVFDDIAASGSCRSELRESLKSSTELGGAVERGSAREDGPPHRDG